MVGEAAWWELSESEWGQEDVSGVGCTGGNVALVIRAQMNGEDAWQRKWVVGVYSKILKIKCSEDGIHEGEWQW